MRMLISVIPVRPCQTNIVFSDTGRIKNVSLPKLHFQYYYQSAQEIRVTKAASCMGMWVHRLVFPPFLSKKNNFREFICAFLYDIPCQDEVQGKICSHFGSWVRYLVWQHTFVSPSAFSRRAVVSYWRKYVHEVLVNRLGGLSLPRKSVVRLTDRPDMTLDVYRGR